MGFVIKEKASVSDDFKTIIQSGNYEKIILSIMNDSKIVFPNQYIDVSSQSNGECDFVDISNNKKFDAKLPITTKQGRLIASRNSDLLEFFINVRRNLEEFADCIEKRDTYNIENITLYQVLKKRIQSDKVDENLIFLFPYPVVLDLGPTAMTRFCGEILTSIFNRLIKDNIIGEREIYVIYPCIDHQIVLRCLNNGKREYLKDVYLSEFIKFDIWLEKE